MTAEGGSLARNTAVMSAGTTLSRLTGFLRLSAMAYALGVETARADAYNVANNTPNIVYELVLGGVLTSVFVPVFVEWLTGRTRDEAWEVARSVLTIVLVALTAVMAITIVAAPWIVHLYTIRLHGPNVAFERSLATFFLRWFIPQIVFYGVGAVATGLLNAHRRFAAPMFAPILNNLIVIATMLVFVALPGPSGHAVDGVSTAQRFVLAIGTTLGVVAMGLALLPSLSRTGFRFRWRFDWRHEAVRRIGKLAAWVFVYVLANQLGLLVVIVLAAGHTGYTAYIAAFTFFQLPHAIFAVSVMTALLPSLSSRWAGHDIEGFRSQLGLGLRSTALILVPAAFGYIALANPILALFLRHGATSAADAQLVAHLLVFFSLGLVSFSAFQLLLRAFYAMQDTRTPAVINVISVALNTGVNLLFFRYFGVRGLALGYATAYTFAAIVAFVVVRRRLGGLEGRRLGVAVTKTTVAGAAAGGAALGVSVLAGRTLSNGAAAAQSFGVLAVQVAGGIVAGLAAFLVVALALRIQELDAVKRLVLARVGR